MTYGWLGEMLEGDLVDIKIMLITSDCFKRAHIRGVMTPISVSRILSDFDLKKGQFDLILIFFSTIIVSPFVYLNFTIFRQFAYRRIKTMSVPKSECTGNGEIVLKVLLTVLIFICVEHVHHQCTKSYTLNDKLY